MSSSSSSPAPSHSLLSIKSINRISFYFLCFYLVSTFWCGLWKKRKIYSCKKYVSFLYFARKYFFLIIIWLYLYFSLSSGLKLNDIFLKNDNVDLLKIVFSPFLVSGYFGLVESCLLYLSVICFTYTVLIFGFFKTA